MKIENYRKAISKVYKLIGQAVTSRIPTLDHIMGVENMSKTDKIWYEAYKKYGNRNHTWQDFRDMFYGDIQTMQKTVVYWKTWDEINGLLSQADILRTRVRKLLKKYDIQSISDEKTEEYEQYKKNYPDLIAAYEKYTVIDELAHVNYSTFTPQIAKLEKEFETKSKTISANDKKAKIDLVVEYIKKMDEYINLQNGDFVVGERIEMYRKIILNNQDILKMAQNFNNLSGAEKIDLARMILDKSARITGSPKGDIVQDDAPNGPHELTQNQAGGYNYKRETFLLKSDANGFSELWGFLKILAHEDAHRIDYYNADYGMIGTQLMKFVKNNYLNDSTIGLELYEKWATEQSSYYIDKATASALTYSIDHQNL